MCFSLVLALGCYASGRAKAPESFVIVEARRTKHAILISNNSTSHVVADINETLFLQQIILAHSITCEEILETPLPSDINCHAVYTLYFPYTNEPSRHPDMGVSAPLHTYCMHTDLSPALVKETFSSASPSRE